MPHTFMLECGVVQAGVGGCLCGMRMRGGFDLCRWECLPHMKDVLASVVMVLTVA